MLVLLAPGQMLSTKFSDESRFRIPFIRVLGIATTIYWYGIHCFFVVVGVFVSHRLIVRSAKADNGTTVEAIAMLLESTKLDGGFSQVTHYSISNNNHLHQYTFGDWWERFCLNRRRAHSFSSNYYHHNLTCMMITVSWSLPRWIYDEIYLALSLKRWSWPVVKIKCTKIYYERAPSCVANDARPHIDILLK